jgi:hypothetical protein
MTRRLRVILRVGWLSLSLGTLMSLTVNAGIAGCASRRTAGPTQASPTAPHPMSDRALDPCASPYLGATKAAPVVPPGCRGGDVPREASPQQAP